MIRRKIVLRFIVGADGDNNYLYKKVTLRHIRPELSDQKMSEFVAHYCSLTANVLEEAVVVDERTLVLEEEVTLFEEIVTAEKEMATLKVEEEADPQKRETTVSVKESKTELVESKEVTNAIDKVKKPSQPQQESHTPSEQFGQAFPPEKKQILKRAAPIEDQGTLNPDSRKEKESVAKQLEQSDIKNQSPPTVKANPPVLKRKGGKKLAKKPEVLEEEIEIWLDDDQDLSMDSLMAVLQKAMGTKLVPTDPNQRSVESFSPALDNEEESMEQGLPEVDEPLFQWQVMPVKKKRMHPPVGKRTKPTKKKRRS